MYNKRYFYELTGNNLVRKAYE